MKKIVLAILVMALGATLTFAAVFALLGTAIRIAAIPSRPLRLIADVAELLVGVVLLVGTIYVSTRIAVRIFRLASPLPPKGQS